MKELVIYKRNSVILMNTFHESLILSYVVHLKTRLLKQGDYIRIFFFLVHPTLLLKALTLTAQREIRKLLDVELQNF